MTTFITVWERSKMRGGCRAGVFLQLLFKSMIPALRLSVTWYSKSIPKSSCCLLPSLSASPAATPWLLQGPQKLLGCSANPGPTFTPMSTFRMHPWAHLPAFTPLVLAQRYSLTVARLGHSCVSGLSPLFSPLLSPCFISSTT